MKSSRNTSTSGKPASGRRTPARKTKAKKKTTRTMPVWMRNTLALIVVGVFSLTFYYFVIRPYSYRWKECYGRKEYGVWSGSLEQSLARRQEKFVTPP